MSECLYEVREPGIGLITFNRPDRLNAWTARMGHEYFAAIDQAVADPRVRVIVVTGAGKGYCAGPIAGAVPPPSPNLLLSRERAIHGGFRLPIYATD